MLFVAQGDARIADGVPHPLLARLADHSREVGSGRLQDGGAGQPSGGHGHPAQGDAGQREFPVQELLQKRIQVLTRHKNMSVSFLAIRP